MKKISLIYGAISGGSMAAMYVLLCLARNSEHLVISQIVVYIAVAMLFVLVFLGLKSYRAKALSGFMTFGNAFKVGILILLASSLCYAILWLILFNPFFKDFMEQHAVAQIENLKASQAPADVIAAKKEDILKHIEVYRNPLFRSAIVFIQAFSAGIILTVIAAFIAKKKYPNVV